MATDASDALTSHWGPIFWFVGPRVSEAEYVYTRCHRESVLLSCSSPAAEGLVVSTTMTHSDQIQTGQFEKDIRTWKIWKRCNEDNDDKYGWWSWINSTSLCCFSISTLGGCKRAVFRETMTPCLVTGEAGTVRYGRGTNQCRLNCNGNL